MEDININIGSLQTSGYDMSLTYAGIEMGRFGELNVNVTATFLDELITEPGPGIDPYDCVGLFADDCLAPTPEWRSHSRLGWESPVERRRCPDLALHQLGHGVPRRCG